MWWKKKDTENMKLTEFSDKFREFSKEMEDIKERLDKVEIKALESRKVYQKKLNALYGDEKKTDNNLNPSVFLNPHGNPISD